MNLTQFPKHSEIKSHFNRNNIEIGDFMTFDTCEQARGRSLVLDVRMIMNLQLYLGFRVFSFDLMVWLSIFNIEQFRFNLGSQVQLYLFIFAMSQFDWPIAKRKVETIEAPQNGRFHAKMKCFQLWPAYIGEKERTLGKTCVIKARCNWEHPWETHWEPDGNSLRT